MLLFVKLIMSIITQTKEKRKKKANKLLNYTIMANYNFNPNKTIIHNSNKLQRYSKISRIFSMMFQFVYTVQLFIVVARTEFLFTSSI